MDFKILLVSSSTKPTTNQARYHIDNQTTMWIAAYACCNVNSIRPNRIFAIIPKRILALLHCPKCVRE